MEIKQVRIPDDMDMTRTYTVIDLGDGSMTYQGGYTKHLKGKFKEYVAERIGDGIPYYTVEVGGVPITYSNCAIANIVETTREELRDKGCKFIIQSDGFKVLVD
tara:strand:+ start:27002 stop:27313 length:312 start_codon:yes stop_codon:yes gene_type:complete